MTFKEYEEQLGQFDVSPGHLWYYALGLNGEAGEASEKIKKYYRDGVLNTEALAKELGDTLWYLTRLGTVAGVSLEDVARGNIEKLTARLKTGTIHGSGDSRENLSEIRDDGRIFE